jgi:hypothetical protein
MHVQMNISTLFLMSNTYELNITQVLHHNDLRERLVGRVSQAKHLRCYLHVLKGTLELIAHPPEADCKFDLDTKERIP